MQRREESPPPLDLMASKRGSNPRGKQAIYAWNETNTSFKEALHLNEIVEKQKHESSRLVELLMRSPLATGKSTKQVAVNQFHNRYLTYRTENTRHSVSNQPMSPSNGEILATSQKLLDEQKPPIEVMTQETTLRKPISMKLLQGPN